MPGDAPVASYWDRYYSQQSGMRALFPSQFAAFALGELPADALIVEFGCGNGRDSLFFAVAGRRVIGVDGSQAAIAACERQRDLGRLSAARFMHAAVEAADLATRLEAEAGAGPRAFYARFLLHAITEAQEEGLLATVAALARENEVFAVEFRTTRDAQQVKVTPDHYRRFIDPLRFLDRARRHGFTPAYFVEGFGFAKYRDDDAHVARVILRREAVG